MSDLSLEYPVVSVPAWKPVVTNPNPTRLVLFSKPFVYDGFDTTGEVRVIYPTMSRSAMYRPHGLYGPRGLGEVASEWDKPKLERLIKLEALDETPGRKLTPDEIYELHVLKRQRSAQAIEKTKFFLTDWFENLTGLAKTAVYVGAAILAVKILATGAAAFKSAGRPFVLGQGERVYREK